MIYSLSYSTFSLLLLCIYIYHNIFKFHKFMYKCIQYSFLHVCSIEYGNIYPILISHGVFNINFTPCISYQISIVFKSLVSSTGSSTRCKVLYIGYNVSEASDKEYSVPYIYIHKFSIKYALIYSSISSKCHHGRKNSKVLG